MGDGIGLHVTIVVLAGPDEPTLVLHGEGDHVVDEAVLVPDAGSLVGGLELPVGAKRKKQFVKLNSRPTTEITELVERYGDATYFS